MLLAADCRTTRGSYIFDGMSDKVVIVTDNIFALTSGSAADTRVLTKMVQYSLGVHQVELDQAPRVKTAARLYQQMMYDYKDSLSASLLLGGYDNQDSNSTPPYSRTLSVPVRPRRHRVQEFPGHRRQRVRIHLRVL